MYSSVFFQKAVAAGWRVMDGPYPAIQRTVECLGHCDETIAQYT